MGTGSPTTMGQIQLDGAINLLLLAPRDVRADRFGHSFDGFGGDR